MALAHDTSPLLLDGVTYSGDRENVGGGRGAELVRVSLGEKWGLLRAFLRFGCGSVGGNCVLERSWGWRKFTTCEQGRLKEGTCSMVTELCSLFLAEEAGSYGVVLVLHITGSMLDGSSMVESRP